MALFRLYKKEWEKDMKPIPISAHINLSRKRKADEVEEATATTSKDTNIRKGKIREDSQGYGRKGISSGLSTIITRRSSAPKPTFRIGTSTVSGSVLKLLSTTQRKSTQLPAPLAPRHPRASITTSTGFLALISLRKVPARLSLKD